MEWMGGLFSGHPVLIVAATLKNEKENSEQQGEREGNGRKTGTKGNPWEEHYCDCVLLAVLWLLRGDAQGV